MAQRAYKYTVVIPSRNRQKYCVEAAQTVLLSERDDIQLIVCDNSDDPAVLPHLINQAGIADKVLLLPSADRVLPMKENWERALDHFAGEWITYIGDDDGFFRESFEILDYLTDNYISRAFTWRPTYYKWPCFPEVDHGVLTVNYGETGMSCAPSRTYLENHMNWVTNDKWPNAGPSIYHGLIHRSLVEITRKLYGRYFLNYVVDYSSAITNATFIEHFLQYHWGVTIMGACGNSNTAGLTASGEAAKKVTEFAAENPELRVMFEEFQTSKLHVPWVASGYSLLLEELGLPFSITPQKFFNSCLFELERVRNHDIFYSEKRRLQGFAERFDLTQNVARLRDAELTQAVCPVGAALNPTRFYFKTEAFGWTGVLDVAKNMEAIRRPITSFVGPHREVLAKMRASAPAYVKPEPGASALPTPIADGEAAPIGALAAFAAGNGAQPPA